MEPVKASGASGIGLFRSEFLFMNRRDLPDEDEQYEAYREVVEGMKGLPVTIRTLDIGADKALDDEQGYVTVNPALGLARDPLLPRRAAGVQHAAARDPARLAPRQGDDPDPDAVHLARAEPDDRRAWRWPRSSCAPRA